MENYAACALQFACCGLRHTLPQASAQAAAEATAQATTQAAAQAAVQAAAQAAAQAACFFCADEQTRSTQVKLLNILLRY